MLNLERLNSNECKLEDMEFTKGLLMLRGRALRGVLEKVLRLEEEVGVQHRNDGLVCLFEEHLQFVRSNAYADEMSCLVIQALHKVTWAVINAEGSKEEAVTAGGGEMKKWSQVLCRKGMSEYDVKVIIQHCTRCLFRRARLLRTAVRNLQTINHVKEQRILHAPPVPLPLRLAVPNEDHHASLLASFATASQASLESLCASEDLLWSELSSRCLIILMHEAALTTIHDTHTDDLKGLKAQEFKDVLKTFTATVKKELKPTTDILGRIEKLEAQLGTV